MKPALHCLLLAVLLSSCTEFRYLTVSGVNIPKNEQHEFISENDTLKVQYHFADLNGKIGISIFNKTEEPLEIDWKKSALIINGRAQSYFDPNATIAATVADDSLRWRNSNSFFMRAGYIASFHGSILINEPSQFIPPASYIWKVPLAIPVDPFLALPDAVAKKETTRNYNNLPVTYRRFAFDGADSPAQLRSYLTFRMGSNGSQREFTLEHKFYVSELWKSSSGPEYFAEVLHQRADRFYIGPHPVNN